MQTPARCFLSALSTLFPLLLSAQPAAEHLNPYIEWETFMEELFPDGTSGEGIDALLELHYHPINLNTASAEALLALPFLTEAQADSIVARRKAKGGFSSVAELMLVENIGLKERQYASLFVYAGGAERETPSLWKRLTSGKYKIETRLEVPLYTRAGNKDYSDEELLQYPNRKYRGNDLRHVVRYSYAWANEIDYGFALEKDPGEPFGAYGNNPYDYVSAFARYRAPSGRWEAIAGDYNATMAQGLILGEGSYGGKAAMLTGYTLPRSRARPHSSTSEANYLRGGLATLRLGAWDVTLFGSYRKTDATIRNDTVTSFYTSGLHRTQLELSKKHNLGETTAGGSIGYVAPLWRVDLGAVWRHYDRTIWPALRAYNKYYLRGQDAAGLSASTAIRLRCLHLAAEGALDRKGHGALTAMAAYYRSANAKLLLQGRFISPRFVSPAGNTTQENTRVANERALLIGYYGRIVGSTLYTAYADFFRFPSATYYASQSSQGMEASLQAEQPMGKRWSLLLRYRFKARQYDWDEVAAAALYWQYTHRLRLRASFSTRQWQVHAALDGTFVFRQWGDNSRGAALSLRAKFLSPEIGFRLSAFAALFFTDDYSARLSVYEPQLLGAGGFSSLYYHGLRMVAMGEWRAAKWLDLSVRYGLTHYFNRSSISSGTELINASSKSDLYFRLALSF